MKVIIMSMPDVTRQLVHETALHLPCLGVASLGANIDEDHDVYIIDLLRKRGKIKKYVTKTLKKIQPDIVGLSSMAMQYDTCKRVMKLIKTILPDVKIALGGYHATLMYEEILKSPESELIDYIVYGEGEESFRRLINAMDNNDSFKDIPSLIYKENGKFHINKAGELLDLADIKPPIRDKRRLTWGYHMLSAKIEVMETSRGCTRACNFCSMRHMYGRTYRTYSIDRVLQEIDYIYYKKKTKLIFIIDDNVVLNQNRVIELCKAIKARNYKKLRLSCQADCITMARNEEMVKAMAEAGFVNVFLGIENGSKKNLEKMNKGDIIKESKQAVDNCHKYGITVIAGLIFGLPDDDEESLIENYEFFQYLEADSAYCQMITPYPKTVIRDELLKEGLVTNPDNFKKYDGAWANVRTNHLTDKELQYLFWYHRENVLGWWTPSESFNMIGPFWLGFWEKVMKPILKFFFDRKVKKHGWEKLYQDEINHLAQMNTFDDLKEFEV